MIRYGTDSVRAARLFQTGVDTFVISARLSRIAVFIPGTAIDAHILFTDMTQKAIIIYATSKFTSVF